MIPDGTYMAVVDRIEDGLAALEVTTDERRHELLVQPGELPSEARKADAVIKIKVQDNEVVKAQYDPEATESRKDRAQSRFDQLSQRVPEESTDESDAVE
jgi:uncharacterized protein YdaT